MTSGLSAAEVDEYHSYEDQKKIYDLRLEVAFFEDDHSAGKGYED